jgi:hypothetical protein
MGMKILKTSLKMFAAVSILLAAGVGSGVGNLKDATSTDTAPAPVATYTDPEARQMLHSELVEFEQYAESTMKSTIEILKSRKAGTAELKTVDEWQSAQLKRFRTALHQEDPLRALVDAWAISKSLSRYLEQNDIDGMSATTRAVGLDMIKRREERLAYIASRYLSPDTIASLSSKLEAFAVEQPIPAHEELKPESRWWSAPFFSAWGKGQSAVEGIFQMSLIPGRALKGVSESGTALTGIRETTAEAVQVIDRLPANIRTEFQVALNDLIDKRSEIMEILGAIDSVSTNLRVTAQSTHLTAVEVQDSMTLARELIPAGESLAVAVERAVNASTDLVKVIGKDSTQGAQPGPEGGDRKGFDIGEYQKAATALTAAAVEIRQMLVEIQALVDSPDSEDSNEDDSGFDVREYGAAADSIQHSTAEIRALVSDLRGLTGDEVLRERLAVLRDDADGIARRMAEHANDAVDHLTLRLIQTAFVVFLLACGYALIQRRLRLNT